MNLLTATNEPKQITKRTETKSKPPFQKSCNGHKDSNTKEALEMQARTAALNDETDNNEEIEQLKDYPEHHEETGVPLNVFVKLRNLIVMIANETGKMKSNIVTESTTNTVQDTIADVI